MNLWAFLFTVIGLTIMVGMVHVVGRIAAKIMRRYGESWGEAFVVGLVILMIAVVMGFVAPTS